MVGQVMKNIPLGENLMILEACPCSLLSSPTNIRANTIHKAAPQLHEAAAATLLPVALRCLRD